MAFIAFALFWILRARLYFFILLFCLSSLLSGASGQPSVRVHGESQVSAEPDEAEMDIAVVTQDSSLEAASTQNAQRVNAVLQSLRKLLPAGNIKTVNLSLNPNYRYPKEGAPTIDGYMANNTVRVTVDNVSMLRKVIDAATKAGAASVNRLNFTLRAESEKQARARALGQAASQAESNAQALAAALKLKLGRVMHVEEGQPVVISPAPQIELGKAQSSDMMPLSPGNIEIRANVNVEYELVEDARK